MHCAACPRVGGLAKRKLYADDEECLLEAQRPVIVNGIEDVITRGDLLDRTIAIQLQLIPASKRRTEAEFRRAFEEARPRLLGALLDATSAAMRELPATQLHDLPRLADFVCWVVAAEISIGWTPGTFLPVYRENLQRSQQRAIESSAAAILIEKFAQSGNVDGTASQLLVELRDFAAVTGATGLPRKPNQLSGELRRHAPALATRGVRVEFDREGSNGTRMIHIHAEDRSELRDTCNTDCDIVTGDPGLGTGGKTPALRALLTPSPARARAVGPPRSARSRASGCHCRRCPRASTSS